MLEPAAPFVDNWHIVSICLHLEAITYGLFIDHGLFNRLLINVPPGMMKSLLVSVMWPAWEWGPAGMPHLRYISTSFKESLTERDCRKMRDLVLSDWYQRHWQVTLIAKGDSYISNTATGWRRVAVFRSLTGDRADRLLIDDPHSTETAESEAERNTSIRIFRESVPLRVNDSQFSAIVIIMQRLHQGDVSGTAIDLRLGYVHVMYPMEFEPERKSVTPFYSDPRTEDGELMFPERFPRATVERDKVPLGSYGVAGQYQQRPAPRGGIMFSRAWFPKVKAAPPNMRWARGWDIAASTEAGAPFTCGVLLGADYQGRYCIADVTRRRVSPAQLRELLRNTAERDKQMFGSGVVQDFPQDPGAAGKIVAQDTIALMAGFVAFASPETGDKEDRARPVSAQAEAGNISYVEGPWNEEFFSEAELFPAGKFKDQIDALSRAFARLISGAKPLLAGPIVVSQPRSYFGSAPPE